MEIVKQSLVHGKIRGLGLPAGKSPGMAGVLRS